MLSIRLARCSDLFRSKVRFNSALYNFKSGSMTANRIQSLRHFRQSTENRSKLLCLFKTRIFVNRNSVKVINVPINQTYLNCGSLRRPFHSTSRRHIHPLLWVFVKPVVKLGVILLGRRARKKFPVEYVFIGAGLLLLLANSYYYYHIEYTPITGRKRYKVCSSRQISKISELLAEVLLKEYRDKLLPANHPAVIRVQNITTRLLQGNKELQDMVSNSDIKSWIICVVDDPTKKNAFVLPSGHIFIFTGMLNLTDNDNQLAVVIGHEMAHVYLEHSAEKMSYQQFLDMCIIVLMAALWTIIPYDVIALVSQWYCHKSINLMCRLPYSRQLEKEADYVGMQIAAKSCFDVREGSVFWFKMSQLEKLENKKEGKCVLEWLSTHPLSEKRVEHMDKLLPKALVLREKCNCPRLPWADPRD